MPDVKDVIKGLECCIKYPNEYGDCLGGDCPYGPRIECRKELIQDALALLKAQEPVEPVMDIDTWKCGNCGHTLENHELIGDNVLFHEQYNYCPECGRAVKWDV